MTLKAKSDIFSKRTIKQYEPITEVDTPEEALIVSVAEKLKVDIPFMQSLLKEPMTAKQLTDSLQGLIFKDPFGNKSDSNVDWIPADEYLSGDVREKLRTVRLVSQDYPELSMNEKALENVQPEWLKASDISVKIGSPFIEPRYYEDFLRETLNIPSFIQSDLSVKYADITNKWNVAMPSVLLQETSIKDKITRDFGSKRANAFYIMEHTLNQKDIRIFDKKIDNNGKEYSELNKKEADIAMNRQEKLVATFKKWVWKDPDRRMSLETIYNTEYNNIRNRVYDGAHLQFAGMNPLIKPRPHQKNAVARHLYGGNNLLVHVVGTGKTYAMIAQAMESKRLGLANKSLFVVPNHLTRQWGSDFLELYPNAKVLVANKKDFTKQNRKVFTSRIATGDYDAVIIGHSQFEHIQLSPEREVAHIEKETSKVTQAIAMLKIENGERYQIKQLELTKKKLESKMETLFGALFLSLQPLH